MNIEKFPVNNCKNACKELQQVYIQKIEENQVTIAKQLSKCVMNLIIKYIEKDKTQWNVNVYHYATSYL